MKSPVDAQLPYRLKAWLLARGFDAIHTTDLPAQNLSTDLDIVRIADAEDRIVISKDSDFFKLHILQKKPARLLMITTGNIINQQLLLLFERNFETILELFKSYAVVEMNNSFVIGHSFE
jgi:predicted nuclease of predicted toxin-antitoxin system